MPRRGFALLLLLLAGCASMARSASHRFAEDLSRAILDQDDLATVRDGAPAYLIAVDALIEGDPDNTQLLLTGARLYGAYASAFVEEEARAQRLRDRALAYARRALCTGKPGVCRAVAASVRAMRMKSSTPIWSASLRAARSRSTCFSVDTSTLPGR